MLKQWLRRWFGRRAQRTTGLRGYLQDFNSQNWRHSASRQRLL
jgi:hypothetical protein